MVVSVTRLVNPHINPVQMAKSLPEMMISKPRRR
jgi:hypothetical protein